MREPRAILVVVSLPSFFSLPPPRETTVPSLPSFVSVLPSLFSFAPEKLEIFNLNRDQMDFPLTNYREQGKNSRVPTLSLASTNKKK